MMLNLLNLLLSRAPLLLVILLAMAAGWLAAAALKDRRLPDDPLHAGLSIERLSEVSQLLTLKVDLADVLISRIDGHTGGIQAAVLIKGDVCLGVDLSQARFENLDPAHHTATLMLSPPLATQPRLDHSRTRIVSLDVTGLWCLVPGTRAEQAIANQAMSDAYRLLISAGQDKNADERARRHAEVLLTTFCRSLCWDLTIRWNDQPATR